MVFSANNGTLDNAANTSNGGTINALGKNRTSSSLGDSSPPFLPAHQESNQPPDDIIMLAGLGSYSAFYLSLSPHSECGIKYVLTQQGEKSHPI